MTILERKLSLETRTMPATSPDFEVFFSQFWSPICAHCYRFLGDRDEAEDIALEVFWKLHKKELWQKESQGGIRSWLYRVATNDALNAIRSMKRRQQYEFEAGREHLESTYTPNPAREMERVEIRARIRLVLSRMKKKQASVLSLRLAGLSYREIAEIIKVSPNSIGTLLARAEKEFMALYLELEGR